MASIYGTEIDNRYVTRNEEQTKSSKYYEVELNFGMGPVCIHKNVTDNKFAVLLHGSILVLTKQKLAAVLLNMQEEALNH